MTLCFHELSANSGTGSVRQLVTTGATEQKIYAIRPHLYKHLAPAGSLTMQVQTSGGTAIASSASVTITDISASNYFHGYVRFLLNVTLAASTSYYISLQSSGYTYSDSAFVAWCTDFDLRKYSLGYSGADPLDMEIFTRQVPTKGSY